MVYHPYPYKPPAGRSNLIVGPRIIADCRRRVHELESHFRLSSADRKELHKLRVFLHLQAKINWHRLFHELIDDFDETALAARQKAALKRAGVPSIDEP